MPLNNDIISQVHSTNGINKQIEYESQLKLYTKFSVEAVEGELQMLSWSRLHERCRAGMSSIAASTTVLCHGLH